MNTKLDPLIEAVMKKRLGKGISIRGLASICGVSFSRLAGLERGEGSPDESTKVRLERWLESGQGSLPRVRAKVDDEWERRVESRLEVLERAVGRFSADG